VTIAALETWLSAGLADDAEDGHRGPRPQFVDTDGESSPATSSEDDHVLLQQIREGHASAFDTLARRHLVTLVRFASALTGDRDMAEDIVQTVLLRLWERRDSLHPTGSVIAYLCAAIRNQAMDTRRRDGARNRAAVVAGPTLHATFPAPDTNTPDDTVIALRAAFFTLPEHYRAALQLRYGQRLGYTDIAAALGMTPKGAERLLARAVEALRRRLGVESLE